MINGVNINRRNQQNEMMGLQNGEIIIIELNWIKINKIKVAFNKNKIGRIGFISLITTTGEKFSIGELKFCS